MTQFAHIPVLADEVATWLAPRAGGIYCDGTLGGAGHPRRTHEASAPDGRLIGIDRDPGALAAARAALADLADRVTFVHDTFGNISTVLAELGIDRVDGFLLDIGPSSPQFDTPERGFSFAKAGPIDMRMDPSSGETALDLIQRLSAHDLAQLIFDYGEERYGRRVAAAIKDACAAGQLATTVDLAGVVEAAIPAPAKRRMRIHPATRTFQALRIAVNHELDELASFLDSFADLLAPGGRCVIISFHSLEDRMVKRTFRDLAWSSSLPPDLAEAAGERVHPVCTVLTKKPIFAGEAEVAANPRARSARLRACEKLPN
jgi:16S rRNA (cytosine1402-N4)-methyltransferase